MIRKAFKFFLKLYKSYRFERKKRRAILEANQRALEERRKFLVLLHGGKLYVVSSQGLRGLIRKRLFKRCFTMEKAQEVAIHIAYPPSKS